MKISNLDMTQMLFHADPPVAVAPGTGRPLDILLELGV